MKQTLNLTIQRKWFDMIAQGIKTEEYRDCENRQVQRAYLWAANDHYWYESKPVAILRNGYTMDSRALVVKIVGFDLRGRENVKHPEWGEPKCRRLHIAVILGEVLFKGKYADAKQWLERANSSPDDFDANRAKCSRFTEKKACDGCPERKVLRDPDTWGVYLVCPYGRKYCNAKEQIFMP